MCAVSLPCMGKIDVLFGKYMTDFIKLYDEALHELYESWLENGNTPSNGDAEKINDPALQDILEILQARTGYPIVFLYNALIFLAFGDPDGGDAIEPLQDYLERVRATAS